MTSRKLKFFLDHIHWWPPFLGAGIRIIDYQQPLNHIEVRMVLDRRNRNYVGTHFGGNLYSMCDPWYMFILLERLGKEYVVWDKSASIEFLKPGRGPVSAKFSIDETELRRIQKQANSGRKILPNFETVIVAENGESIARVKKQLYVRKKNLD